ncbi:MAG: M6 family metalloprotease domain-containing protein, partial [Candidatus Cloacimonadales bacterium]|nr:M6 family metalloprotease domain-containing protein [Candidatus Cloacimonadales bacterium]
MRITMILILTVLFCSLHAAYLTNLPTTVFQTDGTELKLLASGDEFYNWLHDANGFTIIQSQTDGDFYYAERDGSLLKPSIFKVGNIVPSEQGFTPWLKIDSNLILQRREEFQQTMTQRIERPNRNTLNNLSIFIRFSDQEEFPEPRSFYNDRFNNTDPDAISLQNYYSEVSYGDLTLPTYIYPECSPELMLSYQDNNPRAYYSPYNAVTNPIGYHDYQRTEREHTLLMNAVNAIASQVPIGLNIDYNNDGYVDNVCFVIRGPHDAWATLLWAHRWGLYSEDVYINDKQVYDYTFQPENQNTVNVLAHEMFHALGAPDLYHYDFDGIAPVGPWDIMESGFVHMGAHMKYEYGGWIAEIPQITISGLYSLSPLTSADNNAFRIASPYSTSQYFVVEYRRNDPEYFDRNVPGSGLLVYRINANENGNASGPPDEVYIFRVDGSVTLNGSIADAYLSSNIGRTSINDYTNPRVYLNNGSNGGISIYQIGSADETIDFYVDFDLLNLPPLVHFESPSSEGFYPIGDLEFFMEVDEPEREIQSVDLYIDDILMQTFTSAPYEYTWTTTSADIGRHYVKVEIFDTGDLSSSDEIMVNIVDPSIPNLFAWYTDEPVYETFGRGSIPIQVGVDFSLGENEYYVTQVALNIEQDPYGFAPVPGEVHCTVNQMIDDQVSSIVLVDLGTFTTPMTGRYYYDLQSTEPISGDVVLIMDISSYQNILFDTQGVTGHSWLTEPDRPWVDAISRGIIGAADVSMMLVSDISNAEEITVLSPITLHQNYPNPFNPSTT